MAAPAGRRRGILTRWSQSPTKGASWSRGASRRTSRCAARRAARAREELADCRACPRECGVDRRGGEVGFCGVGRDPLVASAFPHFGEEDCLRGRAGSGTLFFSGCNLRCVFCQNADISQQRSGRALAPAGIAALMMELQERGCHNINLVTPEHVVPQVVEAIANGLYEAALDTR